MTELTAALSWAGFQVSIIALIAGIIAHKRRRRSLALALLVLSFAGTLAFSFIGGFSVGRFTAAIPVLVIGYVLGMGRGPITLAGCMVAAGAVYFTFSWLLTPVLPISGLLAFVFGSWAIPLYAILGAIAFAWEVARSPTS